MNEAAVHKLNHGCFAAGIEDKMTTSEFDGEKRNKREKRQFVY